eukprot:scaffold131159_cov28-Tisochrysis_lutea.AAC.2
MESCSQTGTSMLSSSFSSASWAASNARATRATSFALRRFFLRLASRLSSDRAAALVFWRSEAPAAKSRVAPAATHDSASARAASAQHVAVLASLSCANVTVNARGEAVRIHSNAATCHSDEPDSRAPTISGSVSFSACSGPQAERLGGSIQASDSRREMRPSRPAPGRFALDEKPSPSASAILGNACDSVICVASPSDMHSGAERDAPVSARRDSRYAASVSTGHPNAGPGSHSRVRSVATKKGACSTIPTAEPHKTPSRATTAGAEPVLSPRTRIRLASSW